MWIRKLRRWVFSPILCLFLQTSVEVCFYWVRLYDDGFGYFINKGDHSSGIENYKSVQSSQHCCLVEQKKISVKKSLKRFQSEVRNFLM